MSNFFFIVTYLYLLRYFDKIEDNLPFQESYKKNSIVAELGPRYPNGLLNSGRTVEKFNEYRDLILRNFAMCKRARTVPQIMNNGEITAYEK